MGFFQDILRGMGGSAPTAQFKADAVQGGKDTLSSTFFSDLQRALSSGLAAEAGVVAPTTQLEVLPPEQAMSLAVPAAEAPPLMSVMPKGVEVQTAMPEDPVTLAQKPAATSPTPVVKVSPKAPATAAPAADKSFEDLLALSQRGVDRTKEKAGLEAQREALLKQSESEKQLTDEEKIATALLAAVPGLLGAIAGGAISGGYGAAAGAAGGLQGGAQGVQSIMAGKESRRKEAKGDAEQLAARIAVLDEKIAEQQAKAQDRELSLRLQKRAEEKAKEAAHEKAGLERELAGLSSKTQLTIAKLHEKGAYARELLQQQGLMNKAKLEATSGGKVTEFEGQSAYHADAMINAMPALEKGEAQRGSIAGALMSSGLGRFFSDPALQQYAVAAKQFINAINRRESGAALTEREVQEAYDRYLPVASDAPATIEYKRQQREEAFRRMAMASGNAGSRISIPEHYMQRQQASADDAAAIEWAKLNPADPRAQKILSLHGIK
jgi:hypothetical protein